MLSVVSGCPNADGSMIYGRLIVVFKICLRVSFYSSSGLYKLLHGCHFVKLCCKLYSQHLN
jgi:hypothetical protein